MEVLKIKLACALLICLVSIIQCCPPSEDIAPLCYCLELYGDSMMFCSNILSPEQLVNPITAISMNKAKVFSLRIEKSSLTYIPDGIFKDTHIQIIHFADIELMSLSDSDIAFRGLENSLTEIRATGANYVAQWDWQQLQNLTRLELIDVNMINLGAVNEPFPNLPQLRSLGIIEAEVSHIVDSAFASLPSLLNLNMQKNSISELKRNLLPDPAEKLSVLDMSENQLSRLPENFFSNMPNLNLVVLEKNKFVTLKENPFLQAINVVQELRMTGNPFRCDCRMRWIVEAHLRTRFNAECSFPEAVNGKPIRYLDLKDIWC